ncbi:hypothetical protein Gogos_017611 [Gossypium gossypioides]|uniref:Uncharacterized protein n=1 Tax=Gossypium gossypioides TaxID=34282 RepID=A0A7J9BBG3_GOSGO|nr:hypothetical protein [Gossypium gossypioides]
MEHFKTGRKKFSKQIEGAVKLSSQIENYTMQLTI